MERRNLFLTSVLLSVLLAIFMQSVSSMPIDEIIANATNNHLSEIQPNGDFRHEMDMILTPEQRRLIFGEELPRVQGNEAPRVQNNEVPPVISENQANEVQPTE